MVNSIKPLLLIVSLFSILINMPHLSSGENNLNLPEPIIEIEIFNDPHQLPFDSILNLPSNQFKVYRGENLYRNNVYWLRVAINNSKASSSNYFIHFNSLISNVSLFQQHENGTYPEKKGGSLVPERERAVRGFLKDKVPFSVPNNIDKPIIYIRIYTELERVFNLQNIEVLSVEQYNKKIQHLYLLQFFFLGIVSILVVFNLTLFLLTRDRLYLFYFIYVFTTALFFIYYYQLSEKYIFYNYPKADLLLFTTITLVQAIYLWFFIELIKNENIPKWRAIIKKYAILISILCVVIFVIAVFDYHLGVAANDFFILLNGIFIFTIYFILYKKVSPTVKIILTGSVILVIGGLVSTIIDFSKISASNISYYQMGVFIELVLFTIAINFMYNKERIDKVKALLQNSILEAEKLKKEKEAQTLKEEIDLKNRNLAAKTMIISEKEVLISHVINNLVELSGRTPVQGNNVTELIKSLKLSLHKNNWSELETYFNKIHPRFYTSLKRYYPNLTVNERKLCAFLKLNLSTKEIVAITGKNQNTIDVARSRLRKKMGLKSNENLCAVIAGID